MSGEVEGDVEWFVEEMEKMTEERARKLIEEVFTSEEITQLLWATEVLDEMFGRRFVGAFVRSLIAGIVFGKKRVGIKRVKSAKLLLVSSALMIALKWEGKEEVSNERG